MHYNSLLYPAKYIPDGQIQFIPDNLFTDVWRNVCIFSAFDNNVSCIRIKKKKEQL